MKRFRTTRKNFYKQLEHRWIKILRLCNLDYQKAIIKANLKGAISKTLWEIVRVFLKRRKVYKDTGVRVKPDYQGLCLRNRFQR